MTGGFSDKLTLKEKAEEDLWFARQDRALVERLHEDKSKEAAADDGQPTRPDGPAPDETPPTA
ncbi:MAG: hypothetical protein ACPGU7_07750 [Gammaproteobacteria bacterium]